MKFIYLKYNLLIFSININKIYMKKEKIARAKKRKTF